MRASSCAPAAASSATATSTAPAPSPTSEKLGQQLTLIEAEVLDALREDGLHLTPVDARRNIVTRGIDLNALVGQEFQIGTVRCIGRRLCEPCSHLQRLTGTALLRPMVHRGGLRADILTSGVVRVGDTIGD